MTPDEATLPVGVDVVELRQIAVDVALEAAALIVEQRPDDLGVAETKSSR